MSVMIMIANQTGHEIGHLMTRYAGKLGHLYSPAGRAKIYDWQPYALDNGAFIARDKWDPAEWRDMLRWSVLSGVPPLWALVPDLPMSRDGTLERWREYAPSVRACGFLSTAGAQWSESFLCEILKGPIT